MKSLKKSFLFFLFATNLLMINYGFAQQSVDSLEYYRNKIDLIQSNDDLEESYKFFKRHLAESEKINYEPYISHDLYFLSKIDFKIGFYDDSEEYAVRGLKILDELENSEYNIWLRTVLYNHLGKIYKEKQLYSEAIKNYNSALTLTKKTNDSLIIYNNISNILKNQNQFEKSEQILVKAFNMFDRVNDTLKKALILDNLGYIKFKLNKEGSLFYMIEALELRRLNKKYNSSLYKSYTNLSEYYVSKGDSIEAKSYALRAYDIASLVNSLSYKLDATKLRIRLGDHSVVNEFLSINDSINNSRRFTENKFALLKYNVAKNELQSQKVRTERLFYQFLAALIFTVGLALYFILKSKHKKDKLKQVYNTETRISKKVHDEVANDVYQVMTKLQTSTNVNEDVLDDLEGIYTKTRDISKENSAIDVKQEFDELLKDLLLSYKSNDVNVITKDISKIHWNSISSIKKTALYRVLQELMTNMKKHSQATIVVLSFNQNNKTLFIDYKDNGIGCSIKKHNGLLNTETRIKSINGTITFESNINKGFKAKIAV